MASTITYIGTSNLLETVPGVLEGQTSGGLFYNSIFDPSVIGASLHSRKIENTMPLQNPCLKHLAFERWTIQMLDRVFISPFIDLGLSCILILDTFMSHSFSCHTVWRTELCSAVHPSIRQTKSKKIQLIYLSVLLIN